MSIIEKIKYGGILDFVKEYFTLMLAIPYFIGGFRQLFRLFIISSDSIIFFSFSQLLIDGIITTIKIIISFLFIFNYKNIVEKHSTYEGGKLNIKKLNVYLSLLILLVTILYVLLRISNVQFHFGNLFKFLLFTLMILISVNFLIILRDSELKYHPFTGVIILLIFLPMPFSFPTDIQNINKINQQLREK